MTSRESLDRLFEYLRFPSISTQPEHSADVRACAAWLSDFLNGIGLAAGVHESGGHPIVLARNSHRADRRTVLLYGHYDVQPVDPMELWTSAPFDPVIRDGLIAARGATDNKGQTFAHLCGIASALEDGGELPVNLVVLIEGEEEIGSPSLPAFLESNREQLACDVVVISDTGMLGPGVPTLTYGLRGIAALEIEVRGPAIDLHSGIFGGAIANPITALARMLATLHDDHGAILVPGFCDAVRPIQAWEREAWAGLGHDAELLRVSGAPALAGETGFTPTERIWARPTIEINGIGGGYQGEGTKTVLPACAFAKLTCRLVPDQNPDIALDLLEAHLRRVSPEGVTITLTRGHSGAAYLADPHSGFGPAAQRALQRTFGGTVALIREGGSIPIVQSFLEILGVPTLLLGLALPDCNAHSPNETFPVENFGAGQRLNRVLLGEIANA